MRVFNKILQVSNIVFNCIKELLLLEELQVVQQELNFGKLSKVYLIDITVILRHLQIIIFGQVINFFALDFNPFLEFVMHDFWQRQLKLFAALKILLAHYLFSKLADGQDSLVIGQYRI